MTVSDLRRPAAPRPVDFRVGEWLAEPSLNRLSSDRADLRIRPQLMDVLVCLARHHGRVVLKDELLAQVWPDRIITESGMVRCIAELRQLLGDDSHEPRYIETIPKRGYRFAAPSGPAPGKPRLWLPAAAFLFAAAFIWWQFYLPSRYLPPGDRMAQIAVLPFEPLDATLPASLPAALNEQIVAELVRTGGMRVISPSTVARYRRFAIPSSIMARVLGLDVVLEGALQPGAAGAVRITARLADVHSGKLIWAETLQSPSGDLSIASSQIAARIRSHLVLAKP